MPSFAYNFVLDGGRNIGVTPWRDILDERYIYHIRETNADGQATIEIVKIEAATGDVILQGPRWAYATNLDDLGELFVDPADASVQGNLVGSLTGDKLYVCGRSFSSADPGSFDNVIIEFDKATLEISSSWQTSHTSAARSQGNAFCNEDGSLYVRLGDQNFLTPDGYIEILNTTNGNYSYTSLSSLGIASSVVGLWKKSDSPGCFDADENFWFISQTVNASFQQTGKSKLHRATISAAPIITIQDTYELDEPFSGGPSFPISVLENYGHKALWFNPTTGYLNLLSAYLASGQQNGVGWYHEIDPADGSIVRGPLPWSPGRDRGNFARYDMQGRTTRDTVVTTHANYPTISDNDALSLFTVSTGAEVFYNFDEFQNGLSLDSIKDGTAFHSVGSDIIYMIEALIDFGNPTHTYQDIIFQIEPDFVGTIVRGGAGFQLVPFGCLLSTQAFALEVRDLNSVLELGPFRFTEQKESDETSMITTLVLGLTEVDIGIVDEIDMALIFAEVDMETLVDVLGDDIFMDMGEGVDNSDDFTLKLLGNDDGSTYPGAPIEFKPEELEPIEDRGSTKQYSPLGYSYIYHRVQLHATQVDEKFAVKFVDISGQLTGRLK